MIRNATTILSLFLGLSYSLAGQDTPVDSLINTNQAEYLMDLSFTSSERDSMINGLKRNIQSYKQLHGHPISNDIPPALVFNPVPRGYQFPDKPGKSQFDLPDNVKVPKVLEELAFYSVAELSVLLKARKISSLELTELYMARLKKHAETLECMVTLLENEALESAKLADQEIASGKYRGPLHGIPYGLKDLFAVEGHPTTWGAMPFKDQIIDYNATVVDKLDEAGAILIAKLTLGALAMGDVWYGGKTRNPWNLEQGSSGSSAGSGAATAAGLVGFAIGTETLGSIVSPSTRNGVTGLRPTFGRVSRHGAMALSWSMDKVGPMCRTALDCAIVFEAIYGVDGKDLSLVDAPYQYNASLDLSQLRIGYFKQLFDRDYRTKTNDSIALNALRNAGLILEEVIIPDNIPYGALRIILAAEAGAAFDQLTRENIDDMLVRQDIGAWPNFFRTSRFIPAVEYINANRVRQMLISEFDDLFKEYDAIVTPSFGGPQLLATNLTGHPVVCIPNGWNSNGSPTSISILGKLFGESAILSIADAYQKATDIDEKHPPLFLPK